MAPKLDLHTKFELNSSKYVVTTQLSPKTAPLPKKKPGGLGGIWIQNSKFQKDFIPEVTFQYKQVICYFELNPSNSSGVIKIPKKFPFGERESLGQKDCFIFSGPNCNCLPILKSISQKKRTHTQTDGDIERHLYCFKRVRKRKPWFVC